MRAPHFLAVFSLAAALVACGSAPPQHGLQDARTQAIRDAFKKADANNDEQLSREEFATLGIQDANFDEVDTDDNGRVSLAELRSYLEWRRVKAEANRPLDRNGRTMR